VSPASLKINDVDFGSREPLRRQEWWLNLAAQQYLKIIFDDFERVAATPKSKRLFFKTSF
jgi:hypothetical protein